MSRGIKILLIVLGIIILFGLIIFSSIKNTYNTLVALDEGVKTAWAQVENQLQRRFDLIPNYVETVKGFAKQEREVFIKVTEARAKVGGATSIPDKIKANNELSSALSRLLVVVERYPDIKSNQNFIRLQDELAGTENRIAVQRMRYNEAVREFNTYIRNLPGKIFAGIRHLDKPAAYFEMSEGAAEVPKVEF